ncbi:replication factor C subunit 4 [Brettanomyces bruxellensis]|uniref:Replication factor C subunit 4 n=1 Tax=Dekkera bruxellensis TaxID=5007 RepID=A0A3F2Y7R3_DEKBR|nr:replication factor C subunit 4 [Brettanomyces bruxellensis]KAF6006369.1 replication factor C subunit 4 [Brettanomyces bruxellensis]KAF6010520.1 replication factor C subunit 4 [Brettanomyces bruxellensis]QOU21087.1 replication factor C subunit 4 [Brettanomyces bruxellensis]VUG18112.1 RFC4 [Brettanomyces bruxellensis]
MPATKYPLDLELPWVEKYRPRYLKDVVGNKDTIESLERIAQQGNMPHMILSGLPGIGKTTSIMCLARELFHDDQKLMKNAILELNASDDRGIDVVRNQIKQFAQKKVSLPPNREKIVVLDEADSMTPGAQQALRRTMEIYSNTTRFAFACNQSSKIIEPIQSRCAILRFSRLKDEEVLLALQRIVDKEKIEFTEDGLAALIFTAEGDMRQAINNLQSTYYGFNLVNAENVYKIVDSPHPLLISKMLMLATEGKIDESLDVLKQLWDKGYSAIDIITVSFRVMKTMYKLSEEKRLEVIRLIGFTHMRILDGVSTFLQLACMLSKIAMLEHKS